MALGGVAELLFGVRAEGRSLEAIAEPLTAAKTKAKTKINRLRPGPGHGETFYSPGMVGTCSHSTPEDEGTREREVDALADAAREGGASPSRADLSKRVRAREWGPGRFDGALRDAVERG